MHRSDSGLQSVQLAFIGADVTMPLHCVLNYHNFKQVGISESYSTHLTVKNCHGYLWPLYFHKFWNKLHGNLYEFDWSLTESIS